MSADPAAPRRSLWVIFRVPAVLGVLSAVGLVSALLGDGAWDTMSWPAVLSPVAVAAWAMITRAPRPEGGEGC